VALLKACPDVTVDWLCYGANRPRALAVAGRHGVPKVSGDLEDLLQAPVDLVVVASPPRLHLPHAELALQSSARLVVDKPLAPDAAQARRLAGLAADAGVPAITFFQWRHRAGVVALRREVRSGSLGELQGLDLAFRHNFLAGEATSWPWRHDRRASGAGALGDLGVHLVDLMRWISGLEPEVLAATTGVRPKVRRGPWGEIAADTEDFATACFALPGGVGASLFVSRSAAAPPELRIRIIGDLGVAELVADPDSDACRLSFNGAPMALGPALENPYAIWLAGGAAAGDCASLDDGARAQELLDRVIACGAAAQSELEWA
jgi:predicted dehydrogenase